MRVLQSILLAVLAAVFAAPTQAQNAAALEMQTGSGGPGGQGPTTASQSVSMRLNVDNPGGNSFVDAPNPVTVTYSLSNQQYTGLSAADGFPSGSGGNAVVFGGGTNNGGETMSSPDLFRDLDTYGRPAASRFTSSNAPIGQGISTAVNSGIAIFLSADAFDDQSPQPSTSARLRMADLTLTFSRPVSNPILHLGGLGSSHRRTVSGGDLGYATELDLLTPGLTWQKISGTSVLTVTGTQIQNTASTIYSLCEQSDGAACGSVQVNGSNITQLAMRLYLRGDGGLSNWNSSSAHVGDNFILSASLDGRRTLSLNKALGGNRVGAGDQFTVALRTGGASGTVVGSTAQATTTGSGATVDANTGTTGVDASASGTTYTLTEAAAGSTNLNHYQSSLTCTDSAGVMPASALPSNEAFDPATGRAITPAAGAKLVCTITNTPKPPRITLQKSLGGGGRIHPSDQFSLSAIGSGAPAAVDTTGSGIAIGSAPLSFTATAGSSYTLNEAMAAGSASALSAYTQSVACGNAGGPTDVSGITALPIGITPAAGDAISCVITNTAPLSGGGGGGTPPVCHADPVRSGTDFNQPAWSRSGWTGNGTSYSSHSNAGAATQTQAIGGVTPRALLTFRWNAGSNAANGTSSTLQASYGPSGAETVYWSVTVAAGSTSTGSAASNGAACISGCGSSPIADTNTIQLRLPAGIPINGNLKFSATGSGAGAPYIAVGAPVAIRNTGICLAKTSLGSTGNFNFATTGVDTTMGGGGTSASVSTSAVNTTTYYDASATRANNQPLLIKSPGATANVTITETPPAGFVLDSVSCPGLSPTRSGNAISILNVPLDTVTTCTFTNRTPIIRLSKALGADRRNAGDQFTVAIRTGGANGTVVTSTAASTTSGTGSSVTAGTGTTGDFYTVPGTTYTLTESGAGSTDLANYAASLTCSDSAGVMPASALPANESFNPAIGRAITPATGANLQCVITNQQPDAVPRIGGRVFLDSGSGGGTANDGILNGAGTPLADVPMRLTDCAANVYDSTTTDATGSYRLKVPATLASGSPLCVEESNPGTRLSTGASVGNVALPSGTATEISGSTYTYTRGAPDRIAFTWDGQPRTDLNFGDVDNSRFAAGGARNGLPGTTVAYAHAFNAGSAGQVRFSIADSTATPAAEGWAATVFADTGCTGSLQPGAAQLYPPAGSPASVATNGAVCIIVRQFIPATAAQGSSNRLTIKADFDHANATPGLSASFTLEDLTTVSNVALALTKEVRNVTQNGSFSLNNLAKPGDTLEYRITYANNGDGPISRLKLHDLTPAYTSFVSASAGETPESLGACTKRTPANASPLPTAECTVAQVTGGSGTIEWEFASALDPGGTGTVLFRVKVN